MFGGNNKMKEHLEPLTIERHFDFLSRISGIIKSVMKRQKEFVNN